MEEDALGEKDSLMREEMVIDTMKRDFFERESDWRKKVKDGQ
jgi:hypothetical protein